ncbi:hypothetical protein ACRRTK_021797 [Alexandromys fortis]
MVELGCGLKETASSYEMGALTFEWLYKRECKVIEDALPESLVQNNVSGAHWNELVGAEDRRATRPGHSADEIILKKMEAGREGMTSHGVCMMRTLPQEISIH